MYCYKKITEDLFWVGANDRRLAMFEGVYSVPKGVSYNSYLLMDEETVLLDTVDKAVGDRFFENVAEVLGDRPLNYVIVQHMEPDHSATLGRLLEKHPETLVVVNQKTLNMINQFFEDINIENRMILVKEGDKLPVGKHTLTFISAPMVHWPEVMVTYDVTDKILFSADAFGSFGALNGAMFADEVDFERDHLDEARRYYTNIVGKYGVQVQSLLKKAAGVEIDMICPLHGFVWRKNIGDFIKKYQLWSSYTPEKTGVMIAYASVYGNTENAAEILAHEIREFGIETVIFDVSVTPASEIVAAAFKYSHLVFASTTYNAGIFVTMEALLADLVAHNIQNRTVALIENGSWAPTSGSLMREMLSKCKNINILENAVTVRSSVKKNQLEELKSLAIQLVSSIPQAASASEELSNSTIDNTALFKLSYGLFVLTAKDGTKDNGCIINTVQMVTETPKRISITVNKGNLTHDMIKNSGVFNVSILSTDAPFKTFERFGFASGRDTDKFAGLEKTVAANGVVLFKDDASAYISGKVVNEIDLGTHTLFIADVTAAELLSDVPAMTYQYYFDHVKPKPAPKTDDKTVYVCTICGYEYEGEEVPDDFICPWCKHGKDAFEKK